jgi:hypothetical protein
MEYVMTASNNPQGTITIDARGVVRRIKRDAAKIAKGMLPPVMVDDSDTVREARKLAIGNRHKPWARRYLRELHMRGLGRGF